MKYDPNAAQSFANTHSMAVIGLHNSDRIQLINTDGGLAQLLYDVVAQAWHEKVSMEVRLYVLYQKTRRDKRLPQ